jgi:hypothetical protein
MLHLALLQALPVGHQNSVPTGANGLKGVCSAGSCGSALVACVRALRQPGESSFPAKRCGTLCSVGAEVIRV